MHLLQQKLMKTTTQWNNKKLRRGLSRMVKIHQAGTMDLANNKGRVMVLSKNNNTLKFMGGSRSSDNVNINSETHWRKKASRSKEAH